MLRALEGAGLSRLASDLGGEVRVGVVGVGRWGRHWVRVCSRLEGARLVAVCDKDRSRVSALSRECRETPWFTSEREMLAHADLDAVVVATPTYSHAETALGALEAGCHVLVEKPLAASAADAARLAFHAGGRVMVGHLLRYHPAVVRIAELMAAGELGAVTQVLCERLGTAPPGREETAWWALAPHDISVMRYLLGSEPLSIQATSMAAAGAHPESAMAALLTFPEGRLGVVRVADGAAKKVRRITVVGERRSVTFSDQQAGAQLLHYDSPLGLDSALPCRQPVHAECVSDAEPLLLQGQHFIDCLRSGEPFASDGVEGLRVVHVLEAGSRSLKLADGVELDVGLGPQSSSCGVAEGCA